MQASRHSSALFHAGYTTKLSSAGLVYKHYGRQITAQMMGKPEDDPSVEAVYLRVYKTFMEAIDGIDNGAPFTALPLVSACITVSCNAARLQPAADGLQPRCFHSPAASSSCSSAEPDAWSPHQANPVHKIIHVTLTWQA